MKEENGSVYYIITLTDFEQSILQENKPYREWSGNVSIEIDRRQALDIYGNGNLLDTIKDGEIDKNTDGILYSDFIKPEYIYKYSNTQNLKKPFLKEKNVLVLIVCKTYFLG